MSLLKLNHIFKNYRKTEAVIDLSFEIEPGDFVGLIGPNGAGKSTTIQCIAGMIEPTSGRVEIEGHDVFSEAQVAKARLGYVAQTPTVFPYLTGAEYVRFLGKSRGLEGEMLDESVDDLLRLSKLEGVRDRLIHQYSGGMVQKIAICGALVGSPSLLLLDESFVGLDPESTYSLQAHLLDHCRGGGAIILSSHILPMLEQLCTRFLFMNSGRLVEDISHEEFQKRLDEGEFGSLMDLYLKYHSKDTQGE